MGTRADFYVGRGKDAEWLGSIAWDGYPGSMPETLLGATDETTFRTELHAFLSERDDATHPSEGWPWPWEDSNTTDYGRTATRPTTPMPSTRQVWAHGITWLPAVNYHEECEKLGDEDFPPAEFPNMKDRTKVQLGKKSGLLIL